MEINPSYFLPIDIRIGFVLVFSLLLVVSQQKKEGNKQMHAINQFVVYMNTHLIGI
jgi:hypothetical protein